MQIGLKMLIAAVCSLSIGVAFASPLLISDLNIKPWIRHVPGPKAEFTVEVVYANFTVLEDGKSLAYQTVVNITNPSDVGANLLHVSFAAAEKITNMTGSIIQMGGNSSGGGGWEAEGAWVDGKWYNVTWVNGTYPYFDRDGNMVQEQPPFLLPFQKEGYWMEGVQLYYRQVNGTLAGIYMNMNGTWTDITGRTNVTLPKASGFSVQNSVVQQMHVFGLGFSSGKSSNHNDITVIYNQTESYTYWEPHESRLIMLQGTLDGNLLPLSVASNKAIETIKKGNLTLKTEVFNVAKRTSPPVNNTVQDTGSYTTELKQVPLTQYGNSYIYNDILAENQMFQLDKSGIEVFVKPRS